jgi:hypothetical protein
MDLKPFIDHKLWSNVLCCSQSADDSNEDLVKFGYKISKKIIPKNPSILVTKMLASCINI